MGCLVRSCTNLSKTLQTIADFITRHRVFLSNKIVAFLKPTRLIVSGRSPECLQTGQNGNI